jgi:hypothetical protein
MAFITKSEAAFQLGTIGNRVGIAKSAAKEGDWQTAFDNAYEAQDMLALLLDHLEEAAKGAPRREARSSEPWKPPAPDPEPPGSLKYGVPPGTGSKERTGKGAFGYTGGSHLSKHQRQRSAHNNNAPPPVIKIERVDNTPPAPIIITPPPIVTPPPKREVKVGDYAQWVSQGVEQFAAPQQVVFISEDGEWAIFAHSHTGVPTSQLEYAEAPPMPETGENNGNAPLFPEEGEQQ